MRAKDALGKLGEELACQFVVEAGHEILERNWRCARGEIDIVSLDGGEIVFTEVKTRSSTRAGNPLEAITPHKLARMRSLAGLWLASHPAARGRIRLDVIGITVRGDDHAISHVRAVGL